MNRILLIPFLLGIVPTGCTEAGNSPLVPEDGGIDGESPTPVEGSDVVFFIPFEPSPVASDADLEDGTRAENAGDSGSDDGIDGEGETQDGETSDAMEEDSTPGDAAQDGLSDSAISDADDAPVGETRGDGEELPPGCPNGYFCDDGDLCTANDSCSPEGICVGEPIVCEDNNSCTLEECNTEEGMCVTTAIDGVCGTNGICEEGVCVEYCDDNSLPPCPVLFAGNLSLETEEDVLNAQVYTHISGNLKIGASLEGVLTLSNLTEVNGNLEVEGGSNLSGFSLPALTQVDGSFSVFQTPLMNGFDVPLLNIIGETLSIQETSILITLHFPALTNVAGTLQIQDNPNLKTWGFDELSGPIESLVIKNNGELPQCFVYYLAGILMPTTSDILEGNCELCSCD